MKVTKEMIHPDLRPNYHLLKLLPRLLTFRWLLKLINTQSERSNGKTIEGVSCEEVYVPSSHGGPDIRVRVFKPLNHVGKLPSLLYVHGGGYITGNPEGFLETIKRFIDTRPCVVVAPDYRKAFTAPFPAGFNDCYDSLLWTKANSEALGVDDSQFIIAGHSAGGGLTAALVLKARDTQDVKVAFQMPIYPMIDDRQTTPSARDLITPVWDSKINAFAWEAYLSDLRANNQEIPPYAAAARNSDYAGLPPTITFVGDMEPFKDETIAYVEALKEANVEVVFKLFEGCYHGFDLFAGHKGIAQEALDFTYQNFADYYDRYLAGR